MFEILTVAIFIWLMVKSIGFMFKLTWGAAKIVASILMVVALPALIICLVFASGIALLVPIILIAIAAGMERQLLVLRIVDQAEHYVSTQAYGEHIDRRVYVPAEPL